MGLDPLESAGLDSRVNHCGEGNFLNKPSSFTEISSQIWNAGCQFIKEQSICSDLHLGASAPWCGRVAQRKSFSLDKSVMTWFTLVVGSTPTSPLEFNLGREFSLEAPCLYADVVQLVRTAVFQTVGHGFESRYPLHYGEMSEWMNVAAC